VVNAEVIEEAAVRRPIGIVRLAQLDRLLRNPVPGLAVVMSPVQEAVHIETDKTSGGLIKDVRHMVPLAIRQVRNRAEFISSGAGSHLRLVGKVTVWQLVNHVPPGNRDTISRHGGTIKKHRVWIG